MDTIHFFPLFQSHPQENMKRKFHEVTMKFTLHDIHVLEHLNRNKQLSWQSVHKILKSSYIKLFSKVFIVVI